MKTLAQRIKGRTKSDAIQHARDELAVLARLIRGDIRYYSESLEIALDAPSPSSSTEARELRARIDSLESVLISIRELSTLSSEKALDILNPYPNLEGVIRGNVLGTLPEWTMIRMELVRLAEAFDAQEAKIDQQNEEIDRLRDELSATPEHRIIADIIATNNGRLRWKDSAKWAAQKVLDGPITETEQRRARSILNEE